MGCDASPLCFVSYRDGGETRALYGSLIILGRAEPSLDSSSLLVPFDLIVFVELEYPLSGALDNCLTSIEVWDRERKTKEARRKNRILLFKSNNLNKARTFPIVLNKK